MGMALDEPKERDEVFEIDDIRFVVDRYDAEFIKQYGPVYIDYRKGYFGGGFSVYLEGYGWGC